MEIICPQCAAKGRLDDAKIPEAGATVRCPQCQGRMLVHKNGEIEMVMEAQPAINQTDSPQFCPGCGKGLAAGAKFCMYCGNNLDNPAEFVGAQAGLQAASQQRTGFSSHQAGFPGPMPGATSPAQSFHYAGFWIRFLAKVIDGIVLWLVYMALTMIFTMFFFSNSYQPYGSYSGYSGFGAFMAYMGFLFVLEMIISMAYAVYFVGKFGATPGKMVCRLKVIRPDGGEVSYPRALGRFFAEGLSCIILLIGYIMAGFDRQKRALHDHICATRVIRQP